MESEASWPRWFDKRVAEGRSQFSLAEAVAGMGTSVPAARMAMSRAMREKRIAKVGDGFYVVVPPEYRHWGAPPFAWVVDARFARLGHPYYLGVLTAAQYHGAAHQKPMETQVVTNMQMRTFHFGGERIRPIYRKTWPSEDLLEKRVTHTGEFRISCRELTLVDAVRYPARAAGLDNIANIIKEMTEDIRVRPLAKVSRETSETALLQRLGWMLARFGQARHADVILGELKTRRIQTVALEIGNASEGPVDPAFRVRINYHPDPDV